MSTDGRDPLFRGLDELAGLADADHVPDRMAGISRKARANRHRKVAAVGASLAVIVAAGAVGVLQLGPEDADRLPAIDPTSEPTEDPTVAPAIDPDGITVELHASQVGPTTIGVVARLQGTSHEWSSGNRSIGVADVSSSKVFLDGQDAGFVEGPELGDVVCRAGTPEHVTDRTEVRNDGKGVPVAVPGPGTYQVAVRSTYCGPDGEEMVAEASQTVTVGEPELVEVDQASVDVDGDGQDDDVRLLKADAGDAAAYLVAEVTRGSGGTSQALVAGSGVPAVAGEQDLDGDGESEVLVLAEGENDAWWTVLTVVGGEVVAATPTGFGEQHVQPRSGVTADGGYQQTFVRDGQLVSWFSARAWDRTSDAEVVLQRWVLDEDAGSLYLDPSSEPETLCVTADQESWNDPQPC